MKCWLVGGCAVAVLLLGADHAKQSSTVPPKDVGNRVVILGDLGVPVGQEIIISGRKTVDGPGDDTFIVENINGKPSKVGTIDLHGIENWPDETKATLRGNEVGTLRYLQLRETNFATKDPRWKGPYQKLFLSFHVVEVVAPAGLKVEQ